MEKNASTGEDKPTMMEFAVQMECSSCENSVKSSLENVKGVSSVKINLEDNQVFVESTLPSGEVHRLLESTGKVVVFRGHGYQQGNGHLGAAVSILTGKDIYGVVRFVQISDNDCVIDGTVDGLAPGFHGLNIHSFGDLSKGCESTGNHFDPSGNRHGGREDEERHVGDLGNICADRMGRAMFRFKDDKVKVWDVIGRSMVVHEHADDLGRGDNALSCATGNSGKGVACGIIARSAGLFQNQKKICACSGKTLWEERGVLKESPTASL